MLHGWLIGHVLGFFGLAFFRRHAAQVLLKLMAQLLQLVIGALGL